MRPLATAALAAVVCAAPALVHAQPVTLAPDRLTPHGVQLQAVTYKGREALRATQGGTPVEGPKAGLIVVPGVTFADGTIEVDVVGMPARDAGEGARGFIGVAFRVSEDGTTYGSFYLRPTNARAEDQVRRNHTVQYVSAPDFPWPRLRKEFPEMYESYADMEVGEWTPIRVVVEGGRARLFVHGREQPTLVVNDMKLAPRSGGFALWIGPGTEGYFSNLRITPSAAAR